MDEPGDVAGVVFLFDGLEGGRSRLADLIHVVMGYGRLFSRVFGLDPVTDFLSHVTVFFCHSREISPWAVEHPGA